MPEPFEVEEIQHIVKPELRKVTKWKTRDGRTFDNEEGAVIWEKRLDKEGQLQQFDRIEDSGKDWWHVITNQEQWCAYLEIYNYFGFEYKDDPKYISFPLLAGTSEEKITVIPIENIMTYPEEMCT
mgnify:FL=1